MLADLRAAAPPGTVRWVRPEAMHLTVKFYGDVDQAQLPGVEAALARAAAIARPVTLRLEGLGVFPSPRRPQVIWAGLAGSLEALHALQRDVETLSAALGYAPEGRAFKPHLTLGRVRGQMPPAEHARLLEQLKARQGEVFGEFEAGTLSLMQSDLRPTGTVYTTLYAAPLGSQAAHAAGGQHTHTNLS